jgi:hypothetical protein
VGIKLYFSYPIVKLDALPDLSAGYGRESEEGEKEFNVSDGV